MSLPTPTHPAIARANLWDEAAEFCDAARDAIDFGDTTERYSSQQGGYDMADHLSMTFRQMAESARRSANTSASADAALSLARGEGTR